MGGLQHRILKSASSQFAWIWASMPAHKRTTRSTTNPTPFIHMGPIFLHPNLHLLFYLFLINELTPRSSPLMSVLNRHRCNVLICNQTIHK